MDIRQLWVGIDWGTHSSKWWFTAETTKGKQLHPGRLPSVIDSTVYRVGDALVINRERARVRRDVADARLKRLLLKDGSWAASSVKRSATVPATRAARFRAQT